MEKTKSVSSEARMKPGRLEKDETQAAEKARGEGASTKNARFAKRDGRRLAKQARSRGLSPPSTAARRRRSNGVGRFVGEVGARSETRAVAEAASP